MNQLLHDIRWIFRNKFGRWEKFKFIFGQWFLNLPKCHNDPYCLDPGTPLNREGWTRRCWIELHGSGHEEGPENFIEDSKGLKKAEE
jgi:hypothetical protein